MISTVAAFVKEYGVTHIVIGRSQRPWFCRLLGQSVLDQLLRRIPGVDVLVVDTASSGR
ncbi:MAG: universal stress protein [Thermoguttaceae bacterium]